MIQILKKIEMRIDFKPQELVNSKEKIITKSSNVNFLNYTC